MRIPFRTELGAFATVVVASAAAVAIALGAIFGGRWAALGVFLVVVTGAVVVAARARREDAEHAGRGPAPRLRPRSGGDAPFRLLVIANETLAGERLHREVRRRVAGRRGQVLVVAPVLNSKLKHWASDTDDAIHEARQRLDRSLAALSSAGIDARGRIGADDPLQALEDALREFQADEVIISTHPASRSHWLERGLVPRARTRVPLPITHVVVDLERDQALVEPARAISL